MRKVPELRFAGFDGEWEEKEFRKVIERRSKSSENNSLPRVEYEDIIPEIGKLNKDINTKSSIKKGIYFESDDVLFGKLRPYLKNYLNPQFDGIAVGDFWILNNKSGDNSFLFYYIQIPQFQYVANTSIGTKMPRSDWNLVSGSKFIYPSNDEQEKIGNLFRKIDDLIEIQEGKVSKLEDFKKSMLQKMFPKKGELVPEFRFDGFDEEWKNVYVKDIGSFLGGTSIESYFNKNGDYKVISIGSYSNSSKYIDQGLRVDLNDKTKSKLLSRNDLAMVLNDKTTQGNIIGRALLIDEDNKYIFNQRTQRISPNIDKYSSLFLYYFFNSDIFRNKIKKISQGNTQIYVNWPSVESISLKIPTKKEQEKIGQFFKNLDTQIENEEKLLDSYKIMKKSLLQKMFV